MKNLPISPPFSDFPSDVLKWMKANAQSRTALKLMQCNKYFRHQSFPYFVVKAVRGRDSGLRFLRLKPDPNRSGWMPWHFGENWCGLYIDNLKQKLWITEKFEFDKDDRFLPILLSKIAVFDVKKLILKNLNVVTFEMFKLFSSGNVQELTLINTKIRDKNGVDVLLEELFQSVPKLENLTIEESGGLLIKKYHHKLEICRSNNFTFELFKAFTTSKITNLTLNNTVIKDENGVIVKFEDLLERVPKLQNLTIECNVNPFNSIPKTSNLSKLIFLTMNDVNDITFDEFKLLINNGKIKGLTLKNTVIKDENCDAVPLENVLKYLPKLQKLKIECINSDSLIERNRCKLNIHRAQNFTLKDFKALISGPPVKSVTLNDTIIKNENGVAVPEADLLEYLPNLEDFKRRSTRKFKDFISKRN